MKSLLTTLVTLTTAITPVVTTTNLIISNNKHYANNQEVITKPLLSTINDNHVIVTLALGKTFGDIDKAIYNTATAFKEHQLSSNYQVNYYRNSGDEETINNEGQTVGDVFVVITAAVDDPYWKGKTNYLKVTIQKANLDNINTLSDFSPIETDSSKKYSDIDISIFNNAEQFAAHKLAVGFTVHYFQDEAATKVIDDDNQADGTIYVKITAADNDPYWTATTAAISIILTSKQVNLDTVSALEGMPEINIVINKKNSEIDISYYNKSTTFATHKLAVGFTVHYFQDEAATKAIDDDNQADGTIYVKITAADNDPYWTGTTKPLSITLKDKRTDLNTISDLSGMDPIIVDPNLTYQQINKNVINSSNQLKINPLTGNFIIHYFSDSLAKHVIDHHYQQIGTVYVMITPDYHTKTNWKANKTPIAFPITE